MIIFNAAIFYMTFYNIIFLLQNWDKKFVPFSLYWRFYFYYSFAIFKINLCASQVSLLMLPVKEIRGTIRNIYYGWRCVKDHHFASITIKMTLFFNLYQHWVYEMLMYTYRSVTYVILRMCAKWVSNQFELWRILVCHLISFSKRRFTRASGKWNTILR